MGSTEPVEPPCVRACQGHVYDDLYSPEIPWNIPANKKHHFHLLTRFVPPPPPHTHTHSDTPSIAHCTISDLPTATTLVKVRGPFVCSFVDTALKIYDSLAERSE